MTHLIMWGPFMGENLCALQSLFILMQFITSYHLKPV